MKYLLFLLLGVNLLGEPLWIPKGFPVPAGWVLHEKPILYTHSMEPAVQGGEFFYYELYHVGMKLNVGDWLWFNRSDGAGVVHEMTAQSKGAVLTQGLANRKSDGWTPKRPVKHLSDGPGIVGVIRAIIRPEVSYKLQVRGAKPSP